MSDTTLENLTALSGHFIQTLDSSNMAARFELLEEVKATIDRGRKEMGLDVAGGFAHYPTIEAVGAMMWAVMELARKKQEEWLKKGGPK